MGDFKSPGFNRSNLFLRRISNPPGRLTGMDAYRDCELDFKSAVKKCPNLLKLCGFVIRSNQECSLCMQKY